MIKLDKKDKDLHGASACMDTALSCAPSSVEALRKGSVLEAPHRHDPQLNRDARNGGTETTSAVAR